MSTTLREIMSANLKARLEQAALGVAGNWAGIARTRLRTSTGAYLRALSITELTNTRAVISLGGTPDTSRNALPFMVEFGMGPGGIGTEGPYDVRRFLLRASTRNVRYGKDGTRYVNVPFPMRGQKSDVPGPLEIERLGGRRALLAARALTARNASVRGTSLGRGLAAKLREHHVSDALQGTYREAGQESPERTTGFVKFRRASWSNRDPRAWRSQGVRAHHLVREAQRTVGDVIKEVF